MHLDMGLVEVGGELYRGVRCAGPGFADQVKLGGGILPDGVPAVEGILKRLLGAESGFVLFPSGASMNG